MLPSPKKETLTHKVGLPQLLSATQAALCFCISSCKYWESHSVLLFHPQNGLIKLCAGHGSKYLTCVGIIYSSQCLLRRSDHHGSWSTSEVAEEDVVMTFDHSLKLKIQTRLEQSIFYSLLRDSPMFSLHAQPSLVPSSVAVLCMNRTASSFNNHTTPFISHLLVLSLDSWSLGQLKTGRFNIDIWVAIFHNCFRMTENLTIYSWIRIFQAWC